MNYAIETLEKELKRKKQNILNATDEKNCDDLWDAILILKKDER